MQTVTIDGIEFEIYHPFPLQRAWCYAMGSNPGYGSEQRASMARTGASQTAIFERYPQTNPPTWAELDEETHPHTRERTVATAVKLGHLIPVSCGGCEACDGTGAFCTPEQIAERIR